MRNAKMGVREKGIELVFHASCGVRKAHVVTDGERPAKFDRKRGWTSESMFRQDIRLAITVSTHYWGPGRFANRTRADGTQSGRPTVFYAAQ